MILSKKYFFIFIALSFLFTFCLEATCEETQTLTLQDCIELGIKNNFQIKKSNYDILSAREETLQIKSQYEPMISLRVGKTDIRTSDVNPILGTVTKKETLNVGLNKKFYYTGGMLSLDWENEKDDSDSIFKSFNPSYDSNITFSYTQPLLKNFAGYNDRRTIKMSKLSEDIADLSLILLKNVLVNQVEKEYLSLNFAKENLNAQKASLERAKKLLSINKKKLEDGLLEEVDIIATEAAITIREASSLLAEDSVEDAKDSLKRIIGITNEKEYSFATETLGEFEHKKINEEETIKKATSQSPDLKIIEKIIEINSFDTLIKRNERLPSLDLVGQYGLGNISQKWGDNYSAITSGDNPTWYLGLSLNIFPLRRLASSALKQSEYAQKKNIADFEDIKLSVITECKGITRRINTQALYVNAALKSFKLQEKKLSLEEIKFNQGRSSIQWLLAYQDDLSNAEIEYHKALTDYYKAKADLALVTGEAR